jgi:leucyl-tRNA synthetase
VARVMELVNTTRKAIDSGPGGGDPAVREAVEAVAKLLSLVAPYAAEDMWEALGHRPTVALSGWPEVDDSLLMRESVTCVVQVNGKVRARVDVPPDASEADVRAAVDADQQVHAVLGGLTVRRVIVRAPKLVNFVVG